MYKHLLFFSSLLVELLTFSNFSSGRTSNCGSWSLCAQKYWLEPADPGRQTLWRRFCLPCVGWQPFGGLNALHGRIPLSSLRGWQF